MEVKKKIGVWCALFALLVALVPPGSAKANATETTADDVKYRDIEDYLEQCGYIGFEKNDNCKYIAYKTSGGYVYVYEFDVLDSQNPYWCFSPENDSLVMFWADINMDASACQIYSFYNMEDCAKNDCYSYYSMSQNSSGTYAYYKNNWRAYRVMSATVDDIAYSDLDIYKCDYVFEYSNYYYNPSFLELLFENSIGTTFTFPVWCEYAGLNALSSTNEASNKIPYSYNSYWHVVRKTSSGKWLLTTIGSNLGQAKMSLRLTEDNSKMMIYEFSGDDTVSINVRQYEYDTDGWKVRTYDTYSYDDFTSGILVLGAGTGIDSTRMIAYTNTPIYSSDGLSVSIPVSSEYYEVEMPDIPGQEVTPTPTSAPSGGGASSGSMITYKPALSGKVSADSLNMRKEASADSEVVASFIKTWSLTLHGFVNTLDGAVWYFCTAERDGVTYTGYVLSEYVEIVGSSGSSGSDSESTLDEKLAEALEELEALAIFVARVPMIIGIIFSFMPSWCLVLFGFAFGFLVLKAIVSR